MWMRDPTNHSRRARSIYARPISGISVLRRSSILPPTWKEGFSIRKDHPEWPCQFPSGTTVGFKADLDLEGYGFKLFLSLSRTAATLPCAKGLYRQREIGIRPRITEINLKNLNIKGWILITSIFQLQKPKEEDAKGHRKSQRIERQTHLKDPHRCAKDRKQ
jgi:hypothetical protein